MSGRVRRVARTGVLAVAGSAIAVAGALAGPGTAGAQEDGQEVDVQIAYRCDQPEASWPVVLRVTATFPARGTVGVPVRPTGVTLELTVPPEALAPLTSAGAVAATSVVRLDTGIAQGDAVESATWTAVRDEAVAVDPGAAPTFAGTVEPEPVTAGAPGDLSFTAAGLVATITGQTADGAVTEPPNVELTCVTESEDAAMVVVPVSAVVDPADPTTEVPEPGLEVGSREGAAPEAAALGEIPPECQRMPPPPNVTNYQSYCARMAGYTNINKLNTSVLQPSSLINISAGSFVQCDPANRFKRCSENTVLPNLDGEPRYAPAPGSFFAFGFVPTTGTMQLTQLGPASVSIWLLLNDVNAGEAVARLQVTARLFDVTVNGVPLDVGPNCRTATPIDVELRATPATYSITKGGVLTGFIEIPPFSGCGVTEDLDPVVTGLVSGGSELADPRNFVKMTQGGVCALNNGVVCPPVEPVPQR